MKVTKFHYQKWFMFFCRIEPFCILEFKSNKIDLKSDKVFRQKLKNLKKYIYTTENWEKFWVDEEGDK